MENQYQLCTHLPQTSNHRVNLSISNPLFICKFFFQSPRISHHHSVLEADSDDGFGNQSFQSPVLPASKPPPAAADSQGESEEESSEEGDNSEQESDNDSDGGDDDDFEDIDEEDEEEEQTTQIEVQSVIDGGGD